MIVSCHLPGSLIKTEWFTVALFSLWSKIPTLETTGSIGKVILMAGLVHHSPVLGCWLSVVCLFVRFLWHQKRVRIIGLLGPGNIRLEFSSFIRSGQLIVVGNLSRFQFPCASCPRNSTNRMFRSMKYILLPRLLEFHRILCSEWAMRRCIGQDERWKPLTWINESVLSLFEHDRPVCSHKNIQIWYHENKEQHTMDKCDSRPSHLMGKSMC